MLTFTDRLNISDMETLMCVVDSKYYNTLISETFWEEQSFDFEGYVFKSEKKGCESWKYVSDFVETNISWRNNAVLQKRYLRFLCSSIEVTFYVIEYYSVSSL